MEDNGVTELEVQNADKVVGYLSDISGVSFKKVREDIVEVSHDDSGLSCLIDAEERTVMLFMDVCPIPKNNDTSSKLMRRMMELNGQTIHGKFGTIGDRLFYKDNLEAENMDKNELEASLQWIFGVTSSHIEEITKIISEGEE